MKAIKKHVPEILIVLVIFSLLSAGNAATSGRVDENVSQKIREARLEYEEAQAEGSGFLVVFSDR